MKLVSLSTLAFLVGAAIYAIAHIAAMARLRRLKRADLLPPDMAKYFAPVTEGPLVDFSLGFDFDRGQRERLRQGRALKLLFGREHVLIGDPWLTRLVFLMRAGLLLVAASWVVDLRHWPWAA